MISTLPEIATQKRVIDLFTQKLGYRYLGDRRNRAKNSNIEKHDLSPCLMGRGYSTDQISRVLTGSRKVADDPSLSLYQRN